MSELSGQLSIQMIEAYQLCESDDCDRFQRLRLAMEETRLGRERLLRKKEAETGGAAA